MTSVRKLIIGGKMYLTNFNEIPSRPMESLFKEANANTTSAGEIVVKSNDGEVRGVIDDDIVRVACVKGKNSLINVLGSNSHFFCEFPLTPIDRRFFHRVLVD